MEPTTQDVDRAFDEMAPPPGRAARVKEYVTPKLNEARTYLEQHKVVMTAVGFGLGFVLGRMLRRR